MSDHTLIAYKHLPLEGDVMFDNVATQQATHSRSAHYAAGTVTP